MISFEDACAAIAIARQCEVRADALMYEAQRQRSSARRELREAEECLRALIEDTIQHGAS